MTDENIEKIRKQTDIAKIIRDSKCYKCDGKLLVSNAYQTYLCNECGESGNVFTYLMRTTGKSFNEVIKEIETK